MSDVRHSRHAATEVSFTMSTEPEDRPWDEFVSSTPGGHHTQTSGWARVKGVIGWRGARVAMIGSDGRVIGGAQVIYRRVSRLGAIGYVSKGPLLAADHARLAPLLVDRLAGLAKELRIRHLTIQPATVDDPFVPLLSGRGMIESAAEVAPRATILVDVSRHPDEILEQMHSKTRYNVRVGERKGVVVREGDQSDVSIYHQLVEETGRRQGFPPYPERYFRTMWDTFAPSGNIRLSIAELDGEPVSAQIAIPFNDTVVNKLSVWSGRHGSRRPNEAVQWDTIRWSHRRGYRWYDLEGLKLSTALALVRGDELPASARQSVASYKLGFGGQIVVFPPARQFIPNRVLRWGYTKVFPHIERTVGVKSLVKRVRTART